MGIAAEFAFIGILAGVALGVAYGLAYLICTSIYSLIRHRDLSVPSRSILQIFKAALAAALLDIISIIAFAYKLFLDAMAQISSGGQIPLYPSGIFGPALVIAALSYKIIAFAIASTFFWGLAGLVLSAYFIRRKGRNNGAGKNRNTTREKAQPKSDVKKYRRANRSNQT